MGYLSEFRSNVRPLAAASIGLGFGNSANSYVTTLMAPSLIREFGWSRADFAMTASVGLLIVFSIPLFGRLTDLFGVRRIASIGVVSLPLSMIALSLMTGSLTQFIAILVFQALVCVATTSTVYSRVVAERFAIARGLALAIFASSPAIVGALGTPWLNSVIEGDSWRVAYRVAAGVSFVAGLVALSLIPPHSGDSIAARPKRSARKDYAMLGKSWPFWILIAAMILCNLPQTIYLAQLNVLLQEQGVSAVHAAAMLSAFAVGNILGRFVCGIAIDRFPAHIVSAIGMAAPAIGCFIFVSDMNTPAALYTAVLIIGLAFGAEGDLMGILVVRLFGIEVYSSVLGLLTAAIGATAATGAILLSITLKATGSFNLFLTICGWSVLIGGLLFLLLGSKLKEGPAEAAAPDPEALPQPA